MIQEVGMKFWYGQFSDFDCIKYFWLIKNFIIKGGQLTKKINKYLSVIGGISDGVSGGSYGMSDGIIGNSDGVCWDSDAINGVSDANIFF